jgi:menaquinone-9 beta-reductase
MRCSRTDEHITARVLIGADGSNSAIARCMQGSGPDDDDRSVAVRGYFEGVEGPADRADLYFGSDSFPGYCWLFPLKDGGANVGLGMLRNTLPPNREHLRTQLQHMISSDVELRRRLGRARPISNIVGWPLTTYNGDRPLVDDRVLLVGDAAGLINPINGEGIQYALQSGIWAAEMVIECAAQGDFSRSALLPFAHRVAEELGRDFAVTRALVQLIRNQSLNPLWLRALRLIAGRAAADPNYARVVGGVLAGTISARDVIDVEIIRKTLEHSAVKAGAEILATPLTVNGLLQAGIKATQFATEAASTMLHDQAGLERWLLELAARGGDLLTTGQQRNRMEKDRVQ